MATTSICDGEKEMAGPKEVEVCEWGPDEVGRVTLTLKIAADEDAEPAEIKFLGFLKLNSCAGLSLSSTSPRFRVEIEVYTPKFKQEEMYEGSILIYSQGLYSPYYLVSLLVLKHDVPESA